MIQISAKQKNQQVIFYFIWNSLCIWNTAFVNWGHNPHTHVAPVQCHCIGATLLATMWGHWGLELSGRATSCGVSRVPTESLPCVSWIQIQGTVGRMCSPDLGCAASLVLCGYIATTAPRNPIGWPEPPQVQGEERALAPGRLPSAPKVCWTWPRPADFASPVQFRIAL